MTDPRRVAILIRSQNGEFDDKTRDIATYTREPTRVAISYGGGRVFRYGYGRVAVLELPAAFALGERQRIEVDGQVWSSATEAFCFHHPPTNRYWWHIFTANGFSARPGERVRLVTIGADDPRDTDVLRYLRHIASNLSDDARSLRDAYQRMPTVPPGSVLHRYLHAVPIEGRDHTFTPPLYPFQTNLGQREAIEKALRHPISVIDGPPGTGKTQTILNLIATLLADGTKTVAVVSSNNAAVDNVYDKLTEEGFDFLAANLGNSDKQNRFFADQTRRNQKVEQLRASPDAPPPTVEELTALDRDLRRLQDLELQRARLRTERDAYQLEREHFRTFQDQREPPGLDRLSILRWDARKILDFIAETDPENLPVGEIGQWIGRVRHYFKYRALRGVDTGDIELVLRLQELYFDKKIAEFEHRLADIQRALDKADFDGLTERQRRLSALWLRHALRQRYTQPPRRYSRGDHLRHFDRFSHDYPVILSTCHSLGHSVGHNTLVDYLIIDEASQVDLLAAGVAMAHCRNLVVVGDLRQLSHIPEKIEAAAPHATYDYREHSILSSLIDLYGPSLPRAMLREHYRCDPSIIGFCNKKFYDDELVAFTRGTMGWRPMIVARTEAGNHMRTHRGDENGRSNQREIDVIQREVLPEFCADFPPDRVGVTTPYRIQADRVTDALIRAIESDTVHSFQGRAKDAIVMTTVLDETKAGHQGIQFADDPRLVNVAVSRAKKRFVLVTNRDMLPRSRHLRDLIGYIRYLNPHDETFDSAVISVFDLLYRDYSERLRPLARRLRSTSKNRSENIIGTVLAELLGEDRYRDLEFHPQVYLRNLLPRDITGLPPRQYEFAHTRSALDFVVFNRITRQLVCAIEVDGFEHHENDPRQQSRDALKDAICATYGIPLLRLPTTGTDEADRLRSMLDTARETFIPPRNP